MSKKQSYTPPHALITKAVPSGKDYDRKKRELEIDAFFDEQDRLNMSDEVKRWENENFNEDFIADSEAEKNFQQEMYEHGFHIEVR